MSTIKNKFHLNLRQESLNNLMFIDLNGRYIKDFEGKNSTDRCTLKEKFKHTVNVYL